MADENRMTERERKQKFTDAMVDAGLTPMAARAFTGAMSWRGRNRGYLKRQRPKGDSGGAWLAMMLEANPHKISPWSVITLQKGEREVYKEITAAIDEGKLGQSFRHLDRDAETLTKLGVF